MDTKALVADAFAQVSLTVQFENGGRERAIDIIVDPDDIHVEVQLKRRALATDDDPDRLVVQAQGLPDGAALLVVADRVTGRAGERPLQKRRAGFLDLRGRLALGTKGLILNTPVDAVVEKPGRVDALGGKVGLEVAAALLVQPARRWAVRELARTLNRVASFVSEVLAALRAEGLVADGHTVVDTRLFWRLADRWTTSRTYLDQLPQPSDARLGEPLRFGIVRGGTFRGLGVDRHGGGGRVRRAGSVPAWPDLRLPCPRPTDSAPREKPAGYRWAGLSGASHAARCTRARCRSSAHGIFTNPT